MAFSKAHLYPKDLQDVCGLLKGIDYPARLDILFYLLDHGPTCVQDIAVHHPISLEALSGHLAILRKTNFVTCMERYPYTYYQVDRANFSKGITCIRTFLDRFDQKISA